MNASWILLPGALVGTGIALILREALPAPPDLHSAVNRVTTSADPRNHPTDDTDTPPAPPDLSTRIADLVARVPGVVIPTQDLALIGQSTTGFLRAKATAALAGFVMPSIIVAALMAIGTTPPFTIPLGIACLLAALLWFAPNQEIKMRAARARTEFRHAAATYLDLVALERAGDAGPSEALEGAASVGNGWAFRRIQYALERARTRGVDPWIGLRELGDELGLRELGDVADIMESAGADGAAVYTTLRARAGSLRTELLAADKESANQDSERLILPGALLMFLMVAFLAVPAMARILTTR